MKSIAKTIVFSFLVFSMSSCVRDNVSPSGNVIQKTYNLSNFLGLEVSDAFNVRVSFGDTEEVIIEADENLFDYIVAEKNGDYLSVGLKPLTNIKGSASFTLWLTAKQLFEIEADGASDIVFDDIIDQSNLSIDLSSASTLDAALDVDKTTMHLSGASSVDLTGYSAWVNADLRGASEIEDYDFEIRDLIIDARGGSRGKLSVQQSISADMRGASKLEFKGNADIIHSDLSGGSEIIRKD